MEYKAKLKNIRVSPQKLEVVVDAARGKAVQGSIDALAYSDRKWAHEIARLIQSAVNNASQDRGVNVDALYVKYIYVNQAPTFKRFMTRARGVSSRILKRNSNVTVVLEERVKK